MNILKVMDKVASIISINLKTDIIHDKLKSVFDRNSRSLIIFTASSDFTQSGVRSARAQVGKLVVACCWAAVYSTEP